MTPWDNDGMKIAELIKLLQQYPPDTEVYVATNHCGCLQPADRVRWDDRGMVVVEESGEAS